SSPPVSCFRRLVFVGGSGCSQDVVASRACGGGRAVDGPAFTAHTVVPRAEVRTNAPLGLEADNRDGGQRLQRARRCGSSCGCVATREWLWTSAQGPDRLRQAEHSMASSA